MGQTITYDLSLAPAGMVVDSASGLVAWSPTAAQVGSQNIVLRARNAGGGVGLQSFQVTVQPPDPPPVITSTAPAPGYVGVLYAYAIRVQAASGGAVTVKLTQGPAGMSLDPVTALLTWTPTAGQLGTAHVEVTATNSRGAGMAESFDLPVLAAPPNHSPDIT